MRVRDRWFGGYSYAQNRGNQENARKAAKEKHEKRNILSNYAGNRAEMREFDSESIKNL